MCFYLMSTSSTYTQKKKYLQVLEIYLIYITRTVKLLKIHEFLPQKCKYFTWASFCVSIFFASLTTTTTSTCILNPLQLPIFQKNVLCINNHNNKMEGIFESKNGEEKKNNRRGAKLSSHKHNKSVCIFCYHFFLLVFT